LLKTDLEKKILKISACLVLAASVAGCGAFREQDGTVTLDLERRYQTITGWEAVAQAGQDASPGFDRYRDRLFEMAVNDLGINRLRLEIRSGQENPIDYYRELQDGRITEARFKEVRYEAVDDNGDARILDPLGFKFSETDGTIENVVIPIRNLLANRGESLYLNLTFVDFSQSSASSLRHNERPAEYAEFMLAFFKHMQAKYGFTPDAIGVILEPDNTRWTGKQIGEAINSTATLLRNEGFTPKFIAPSTTSMERAVTMIDEIEGVPGAVDHISEFSYHRYRGVSTASLAKLAEKGVGFGKQTSMLEWIGADHYTLHEDLTIGNVSAWQQYTLAFPDVPDNGAQYFIIRPDDTSGPSAVLSDRAKYLRQFFYYVRSGSSRVAAESTNPFISPIAFVTARGTAVVVILAKNAGNLSIAGLPAGRYTVTHAIEDGTGAADDATVSDGEVLAVRMPGTGVLTVAGAVEETEKRLD
jgi:hypothetical protein